MKQNLMCRISTVFLFSGMFVFTACHSSYELANIDGGRVEITSVYDSRPDQEAVRILAPYKVKVDSVMSPVIGRSKVEMDAKRPESLLSNFAADVLRQAASAYTGTSVDVAITNMGGLRNSLPEGDVTFGDIYEIFPFENALCILTMNGEALTDLFTQIAKLEGEGLSGARLLISKDGQLKQARINGKVIVSDKIYQVATIDYLAEGNDGMNAFLEATGRVCPDGVTIRQIVVDYIKGMAAEGKAVSSVLDGRITVE